MYTYFAIFSTLMWKQTAIDHTPGGFFPPKYWWNQLESASKFSVASTYDNVEAIWKQILFFISYTFDKINIFQGDEAKVMINTSDWPDHFVKNVGQNIPGQNIPCHFLPPRTKHPASICHPGQNIPCSFCYPGQNIPCHFCCPGQNIPCYFCHPGQNIPHSV